MDVVFMSIPSNSSPKSNTDDIMELSESDVVFDFDEEFNGMDMNTTAILASVKEIYEHALQNYGILVSTFALLLGYSILNLDCTIPKIHADRKSVVYLG